MENKKYKVEFIQSEKFVVDVLAKDEAEATLKAMEDWDNIKKAGMEHYYKVGDTETEVGNIYDVSNTDDPFNPKE